MFSRMKSVRFITLVLVLLPICPFGLFVEGVDGNDDIRVYFSPNGRCEKVIIEEILKAKSSIHVAMFKFTNGRIARALVQASRQGIDVKVLMDRESAQDTYSKGVFLKNKGVSVALRRGRYRDNRGHGAGLMHNKFAIIDGKIAIVGSYNWTASAEKWNNENLLIISAVSVARLFEREFSNLWTKK